MSTLKKDLADIILNKGLTGFIAYIDDIDERDTQSTDPEFILTKEELIFLTYVATKHFGVDANQVARLVDANPEMNRFWPDRELTQTEFYAVFYHLQADVKNTAAALAKQ